MFGHVRLNHAKMLSCGSQRAEASSPIQIAASRCHSLAAESPYCIGVWSGVVFFSPVHLPMHGVF